TSPYSIFSSFLHHLSPLPYRLALDYKRIIETELELHDLFKQKLQWSFRAKYRPVSRKGIPPRRHIVSL
ncbi:hypothetical protein, partial [Chlorobium limicola]|uniref:hypothetical protein n=1 Tax=Chlorobium limicola TaxID=1092 RepID=UPI001F34D6BE